MSESISQFSAIELPDHIAKEFSIDEKTGQGFVGQRGTARLSGVSQPAIYKLLGTLAGDNQNLPEILKPFAGQEFKGDNRIPDVLAAGVG